jgi:formylglycine-generating enzyme required for sulfatase activity
MRVNHPEHTFLAVAALAIGLSFQSCEEEVSVTVKTYQVENVTVSSGDVRCTVTIEGGELSDAGLCYSATLSYPKITNSRYKQAVGSLTDFTARLSGLSTDSTYRFRAYATVGDTTYYGTVYSFSPTAISMDMVFVEGGTFTMGSSDETTAAENEMPAHPVTLGSFSIGRHEVTTSQFVQFLNSRHITSAGSSMTTNGTSYTLLKSSPNNVYYDSDSDRWFPRLGFEGHPMMFVTWYGANEFCLWAGGHLPTEAEWEFAARGGRNTANYLYSGSNNPAEVAWYYANTKDQPGIEYTTQMVGGKNANELGIYDMSGNVWEWCADWYTTYTSAASNNPAGPDDDAAEAGEITTKVRRGGGWADTNVSTLKVRHRNSNTPSSYAGSVGFRFADYD